MFETVALIIVFIFWYNLTFFILKKSKVKNKFEPTLYLTLFLSGFTHSIIKENPDSMPNDKQENAIIKESRTESDESITTEYDSEIEEIEDSKDTEDSKDIEDSKDTKDSEVIIASDQELIKLYQEVFDAHSYIEQHGYNNYDGDVECSFLLNYLDSSSNKLGYSFVDIDGDGIGELFINDINEELIYIDGGGNFLACYTAWNNEISALYTTEERFGSRLTSNLSFYNHGSGGASTHYESVSKFKNGKSLQENGYIYERENPNSNVPTLYSYPVRNGVQYSNETKLATAEQQADALRIKNNYSMTTTKGNWHQFTYKPLPQQSNQNSSSTPKTQNVNVKPAHIGVSVSDLSVGDKIGDFIVENLILTDKNSDIYYYDYFEITLAGSCKAKIKSLFYDEYFGSYTIELAASPLSINNLKSNPNNDFQDFTIFNIPNSSDLNGIFSKQELDQAYNLSFNSEALAVDKSIEIKNMTNAYQYESSGWGNSLEMVPIN